MDLIRSVIIDDEKRSVELLEALLGEYCPQVKIIDKSFDVKGGIHSVKKNHPQLIFLDIAMPDGDGFAVLEEMSGFDFDVIFTTAYNQYALKAFEFSALHYLLKPINIDALKEAVGRFGEKPEGPVLQQKVRQLKENLQGAQTKIALAHRHGYDFVQIEHIVRVEGEDNYSRFFLKNGKCLLVSRSIGEYEKLLNDQLFFRVHKKHLINLMHVTSFQRGKQGTIVLDNQYSVPLSYRRKDAFMEQLKTGVVF